MSRYVVGESLHQSGVLQIDPSKLMLIDAKRLVVARGRCGGDCGDVLGLKQGGLT
jgi:hypothetical protein